MNLVPPLPGQPLPSLSIHLRRCVRHPPREAAARCPVCVAYFCRECVVEHTGRLLCSPCLAKELGTVRPARQRWRLWRKRLTLIAAVSAAWIAFYVGGELLLRVPPKFHDGSIWSSLPDGDDAP